MEIKYRKPHPVMDGVCAAIVCVMLIVAVVLIGINCMTIPTVYVSNATGRIVAIDTHEHGRIKNPTKSQIPEKYDVVYVK